MPPDETLEITGSRVVSAIIDDQRATALRVVGRFGEMALQMANLRPVDDADRLGPLRFEIDTRAGGCAVWPKEEKRHCYKRCKQSARHRSPLSRPASLHMQRSARDRQRSLFHRLRQCRMRMARAGKVFRRPAKFHQHRGFGDHVARIRPDDLAQGDPREARHLLLPARRPTPAAKRRTRSVIDSLRAPGR